MFTDLAVIDWIALVFAAVILAAACSAAIIAYATSSRGQAGERRRAGKPATSTNETSVDEPSERTESSERAEPSQRAVPSEGAEPSELTPSLLRWSRPVHAAEPDLAGTQTISARAIALSEAAPEPDGGSEMERRLADRAARLRGRPVPEPAPQPDRPELEHTPRVRNVMVRSTPAHAVSTGSGLRAENRMSSNYDRAEGFKARNPGFFDDPMGRHELRYWDGHAWTEYVKERGERFTDPL